MTRSPVVRTLSDQLGLSSDQVSLAILPQRSGPDSETGYLLDSSPRTRGPWDFRSRFGSDSRQGFLHPPPPVPPQDTVAGVVWCEDRTSRVYRRRPVGRDPVSPGDGEWCWRTGVWTRPVPSETCEDSEYPTLPGTCSSEGHSPRPLVPDVPGPVEVSGREAGVFFSLPTPPRRAQLSHVGRGPRETETLGVEPGVDVSHQERRGSHR